MAERAGPFVLAVADLLRRPGSRREVTLAAPLAELALSSSQVPSGGEVRATLTLDSLPGTLVVSGTVEAPWEGECRRCLVAARGTVRAEVREVYAAEGAAGGGGDDAYPLEGDHVDLESMVRDAVLLALPIAPLCADACTGPAPDDHPITVAADDDAPERSDPRWSPLDALRFDQ